jgi:serine phosphatase RsbU (regulator of sigma subunit)
LLLRAGAHDPELLEQGELVLGSVPGVEYSEHLLDFHTGDKLLLYTDGVVEATNAAGEQFGVGRLQAAAAADSQREGRELLQAIVADLHAFMGPTRATDDITLIVAASVRDRSDEHRWLETESHP